MGTRTFLAEAGRPPKEMIGYGPRTIVRYLYQLPESVSEPERSVSCIIENHLDGWRGFVATIESMA